MTIETLVTKLSTKFDVSMNSAPLGTKCPYLVITDVEHPNIGADDKVYVKTTECTLRLVESEVHDWDLIQTLEDTLDELEIYYSSADLWEPKEHICEMRYFISFYGGTDNGWK